MPGADGRRVVKSEGLDRRRGYPCYMLIFKYVAVSRPIRYRGISVALSGCPCILSGTGDLVLTLPGCVCPKVKDMGPLFGFKGVK